MVDELLDLDFDALGGEHADALSSALEGPSPYNGSLPYAVEMVVFYTVVDDDFVVQVRRPSGAVLSRIASPVGFNREAALCWSIAGALKMDVHDALADTTSAAAALGYRFISKPTGAVRGHVEDVLLIADPISELDAALQLGADPDHIYDMLDAGANPSRAHIKFGRPLSVAARIAERRPDYEEVVAYMRACGAT